MSTVQLWVRRSQDVPLDQLAQIDWADGSHAPRHQAKQTPVDIERRILELRDELARASVLGEYGAVSIHQSLAQDACVPLQTVPSISTINRILGRHGIFDVKRRVRRPPPVSGWYLPQVARRKAEIDETDGVEGLVLEGGPEVYVLNLISLHGGLCASWPTLSVTAALTCACLLAHWRAWGLPDYAQFDNATCFQGPHQYPDTVGSVTRLCLSLHVTPVFAVPREFGIQSAIESYNNRWQQKVWQRYHYESLDALAAQSSRYVEAVRQKLVRRRDTAPARRAFPTAWSHPTDLNREGNIIYLRRTSEQGTVELLGREHTVDTNWTHRLVRCEVDLSADMIRIYGLRRQAPDEQRLLIEIPYRLPDKSRKTPTYVE
jgi:hypothetical protein